MSNIEQRVHSDVFTCSRHIGNHRQWPPLLFLQLFNMGAGACCLLFGHGRSFAYEAGKTSIILRTQARWSKSSFVRIWKLCTSRAWCRMPLLLILWPLCCDLRTRLASDFWRIIMCLNLSGSLGSGKCAHPPVWGGTKIHRPWAYFQEIAMHENWIPCLNCWDLHPLKLLIHPMPLLDCGWLRVNHQNCCRRIVTKHVLVT